MQHTISHFQPSGTGVFLSLQSSKNCESLELAYSELQTIANDKKVSGKKVVWNSREEFVVLDKRDDVTDKYKLESL